MTAEPDGQRRAEQRVAATLARDAFSRWLGLHIVSLRPGGCTVRMLVRADMLNGFGVCHGGVTYALADSALAFASNMHGRITLSVQGTVAYPAPARAGDILTAVADEESAGERLGFYGVTVRRQDHTIVALFRGTVYRTAREMEPLEMAGNE